MFSCSLFLKKTLYSVLGHVPTLLDDHLEPSWHGHDQLLPVLQGDALHPQLGDFSLQLRNGASVPVLQLVLGKSPHIFYRIQVWGVTWLLDDLERLLFWELHDLLGLVTGGAILEELGRTVDVHERQQMIIQHLQIHMPVHHLVLRQEEEASPSNFGTKALTNHHRIWMLCHLDCETGLKLVRPDRLPRSFASSLIVLKVDSSLNMTSDQSS